MSKKTDYCGIALIILSVGIIICLLASYGYNTYLSYSKEKIEIRTQNSDFNLDK